MSLSRPAGAAHTPRLPEITRDYPRLQVRHIPRAAQRTREAAGHRLRSTCRPPLLGPRPDPTPATTRARGACPPPLPPPPPPPPPCHSSRPRAAVRLRRRRDRPTSSGSVAAGRGGGCGRRARRWRRGAAFVLRGAQPATLAVACGPGSGWMWGRRGGHPHERCPAAALPWCGLRPVGVIQIGRRRRRRSPSPFLRLVWGRTLGHSAAASRCAIPSA